MQRIMGMARKAITEYDMIQNGDRVAVGVSGGKDSVALTMALDRLRRFIGIDYEGSCHHTGPVLRRGGM